MKEEINKKYLKIYRMITFFSTLTPIRIFRDWKEEFYSQEGQYRQFPTWKNLRCATKNHKDYTIRRGN